MKRVEEKLLAGVDGALEEEVDSRELHKEKERMGAVEEEQRRGWVRRDGEEEREGLFLLEKERRSLVGPERKRS